MGKKHASQYANFGSLQTVFFLQTHIPVNNKVIKLGGGGLYTQFPLFSLDLFFVVFHRLTIKGLYLNILSLQSSIHFFGGYEQSIFFIKCIFYRIYPRHDS